MTLPSEPEDAQWLDALAGNPANAADPNVNRQAMALRKALQARKDEIDKKVPEADSALFQQIRFRLRREGLGSKEPIWKRPSSWAVAASLVLGMSLVVNMKAFLPEPDESTIVRGAGQASVLIVTDPEARLAELLQGLTAAKAEPKVERLSKSKIELKLKATQAALDYLDTQRINPKVVEGQVVLLITTPPAKP